MTTVPDQSDESVTRATGRGWRQWVEMLDAHGAADLPHREIVAVVREHGRVASGWWQQSVAVGYEKLKGRRVTGETAGTGVQVGVQRTLGVDAGHAWKLLTSPEGLRAWLGAGADLRLEKGERYRLGDGAQGEVRVVRPGKHARLTYHPPGWSRASTIQVRVEEKGERSLVGFHEEHLPGLEERESRRAHFGSALDELGKLASG
jgi:uncharacterized protein YndB with AHSA1/START domain